MVSIPWEGVEATIPPMAEALAGKVVISVVNALRFGKSGAIAEQDLSGGSCGQRIQELAPEAKVVVAFNNLPAAGLQARHHLNADVLVCGKSKAAREEVIELAKAIPGTRGLDAGPLANALIIEGMTAVIINLNKRYGGEGSLSVSGLENAPAPRVALPGRRRVQDRPHPGDGLASAGEIPSQAAVSASRAVIRPWASFRSRSSSLSRGSGAAAAATPSPPLPPPRAIQRENPAAMSAVLSSSLAEAAGGLLHGGAGLHQRQHLLEQGRRVGVDARAARTAPGGPSRARDRGRARAAGTGVVRGRHGRRGAAGAGGHAADGLGAAHALVRAHGLDLREHLVCDAAGDRGHPPVGP